MYALPWPPVERVGCHFHPPTSTLQQPLGCTIREDLKPAPALAAVMTIAENTLPKAAGQTWAAVCEATAVGAAAAAGQMETKPAAAGTDAVGTDLESESAATAASSTGGVYAGRRRTGTVNGTAAAHMATHPAAALPSGQRETRPAAAEHEFVPAEAAAADQMETDTVPAQVEAAAADRMPMSAAAASAVTSAGTATAMAEAGYSDHN